MLDKTLGYILCCQSPALFLAALALLVAYLAGRKHKVRAFFRLLLCILCACRRRGAVFPGDLQGVFHHPGLFPDPHCGLDRPGHRGVLRAAGTGAGVLQLPLMPGRDQKAAIRVENERLAREAQEAA